jgi:predicted GNAT family N-acyltransferase
MNVAFREPRSERELADLFKFRQSVYAQTDSLKSMVQKSDVTFFDQHALHFAAYHENQVVAYMRMVQKTDTKFADWVKNSSTEKDHLNSDNIEFPFENYSPNKAWNKDFLSRFENQKIGEAGKLAIAKNYRSDIFLAQFVQSFLDYCIEKNGFHSGFGVCTLELERFYKRLGFYRPEGAEPFAHADLPLAVIVQFDAAPISQSNSALHS